jgi:hypothetical protein
MKRLAHTVAVATLLAVMGCGGASAEEQIRDSSKTYVEHVRADRIGDACRMTTDHNACLAEFAKANAFGVKPSDLLTGNEEQRIKTMKVTVDGDHARSARGNEYVKRDGKWLLVLKTD